MKLIEAAGKELLHTAGIKIQPNLFLQLGEKCPEALPWPTAFFVKPQIWQGRRGARGLLVVCEKISDLPVALELIKNKLSAAKIPCAGFLLEPKLENIKNEWFFSIDIDRAAAAPRINFSQNGGGLVAAATSYIVADAAQCAALPLPAPLQKICAPLLELFWRENILNLEINPLAECADGSLVALDAKIELDDAARGLHLDWQPQELSPNTECVGNIALLLFGGGASLLALDALVRAGGQPANYIELSGNPYPEKVAAATRLVLAKPKLRALWIAGSFANFTDILIMTQTILETVESLGLNLLIFIRRDGPRAAEAEKFAREWAARTQTPLVFNRADVDFDTAAQELMTALNASAATSPKI